MYLLLVALSQPSRVVLRGRNYTLDPGVYIYVGRAGGRGGVRARVARHARKEKAKRWHIDQLTAAKGARILGVVSCESEDLVEAESCLAWCLILQGHPYVPGFGSTDTKDPSHLIGPLNAAEAAVAVASCSEKCCEEALFAAPA